MKKILNAIIIFIIACIILGSCKKEEIGEYSILGYWENSQDKTDYLYFDRSGKFFYSEGLWYQLVYLPKEEGVGMIYFEDTNIEYSSPTDFLIVNGDLHCKAYYGIEKVYKKKETPQEIMDKYKKQGVSCGIWNPFEW